MKVLFLVLFLPALSANSQSFPHKQAHAHNDYVHTRPLLEAIEEGFTSIEADIHLLKGKLVVSHDHPMATAPTLETLYLKRLDSIISKRGGSVYDNYPSPVTLMIDIKTAGEETFNALIKVLSAYSGFLHTPVHQGAVRIVISGNRPFEAIKNDKLHLTSIDGRPGDLGKNYSPDLMPVISENYAKVTSADPSLFPTKEALDRIKKLADRVHSEKKQLRLWAIPDNEKAWKQLLDAGVDIINTDNLSQLHVFLTKNKL